MRGPGFEEKLGAVDDSRLADVGVANVRDCGGLQAIECHLWGSYRREESSGLVRMPPLLVYVRHRWQAYLEAIACSSSRLSSWW